MAFKFSVISSSATFGLVSNPTTTDEGTTSTVTLTTTGVQNGQAIPYTITGTGITTADIGGASLTGNFIVQNGHAAVVLTISNDLSTEGFETLTLTLDYTAIAVTVGINDTSNAVVTDTYWANVSMLLHFDGANNGTTFTDQKGHTLAVNTAITSTAQSKFGGASGYFNGTNSVITSPSNTDFNLGTGDFTIEMWIYSLDASADYSLLCNIGNQDNNSVRIAFGDAGYGYKLFYNCGTLDSNNTFLTSSTKTSLKNGWHHIALTRASGVSYIFIDGTLQSTTLLNNATAVTSRSTPASIAANLPVLIGGFAIANPLFGYIGGKFNGYIDDLRITKGVARYTASFTAPTAVFPDA